MEVYNSDDEQVEALKKWWAENGKSIIGGIVLGLGGVLGWQGWQGYQKDVSEQGAAQFNQLSALLKQGNVDRATTQAQHLVSDYQGTAYGVFGAWALASMAVNHGDLETASSHLQWAMDNSPDQSTALLSRLRLARVLVSSNQLDAAMNLIQGQQNNAFAAEFEVLAGDIAAQQGNVAEARAAYRRALQNDTASRIEVEMKLYNLGPGAAEQSS